MDAKLMLCDSIIFQIALKSFDMNFRELFFNITSFDQFLIIV
ncbi:hypothetical protein BDFB_004624 [Asbolus verrucosus]|uniref:Uncharacterized protein n=1 Tax=Asbolus verrucosus TaxID=1661398 RepID=A0A482W8W5_ASBVE|nr:hypothetical protein BDFB_004624 [Asbolus verrucosus]